MKRTILEQRKLSIRDSIVVGLPTYLNLLYMAEIFFLIPLIVVLITLFKIVKETKK